MSNSRVSRSESKTSKSYLHQPIEYRKVMRLRSDHHPQQYSPQTPSRIIKRQGGPSESHLQRLINLQGPYVKSRADKKSNLSPSPMGNRYSLTPLNQLKSSKNKQTLKNSSLSIVHGQDTSKSFLMESADKQKLAIKQNGYNFNEQQSIINQLIEKINNKISKLVNRKLQITFDSLHHKNKQQFQSQKQRINDQLLQLIQQIRLIQSRTNEMTVLNQKIHFIQTIMAEQSTEAELMKKHYYNLSSNKLKGKIGDFNHLQTKVGDVYKSASHYQDKRRIKTQVYKKDEFAKKLLFKQSTNKSSYKSPNKSDYQSYRYRQKCLPLNLQPLPRSSYKRDFLYLKSLPDQKIVNRDHSPYYPANKLRVGSIYGQDYKNTIAETVNHRDLDAFKNKIKTLKISYMPKNKVETQIIDKRDYYKDVEQTAKSRIRSNNSGRHNYISQTQLNFNKKNLLSESKRQYLGQKSYQPSKIKHQQLQSMHYQLKLLFKA